MKNMALKEESKLKILGLKGHHRKNSLKFSSDSICNNANSLPVCQKPAFLTLNTETAYIRNLGLDEPSVI